MSKCLRCNIEILDAAVMCPLCKGVLKQSEISGEQREGTREEQYHSRSLMYPDISPAIRKLGLAMRITVFCAVLAECVLLLINYLTYQGVKWSLMSGAGLAYACFTFIYSCRRNKSIQKKLIAQLVTSIVLAVALDFVIGYSGWALSLAAPVGIMIMDAVIIVLMLTNTEGWQSYIMSQLFVFFVSIVFVVLALLGIVEHTLLTIIAVAVSGLILLGTLVFGDRLVTGELKRRFRI